MVAQRAGADGPAPADSPLRRTGGRRRQPRAGAGRAIGYAALGLGCLLLAAATFLVVAAPVDLVRDRAVALVKERTGRDLAIGGPASLSWLPFGFTFSDVSLSGPEGFGGPPLLAARGLRVELPVWGLVTGSARPRRIVVEDASIGLHVDAAGLRSWDIAAIAPDGRPRKRSASGASAAPDRQAVPAAAGLKMDAPEVLVRGGTVRYSDERSGQAFELAGLELDVSADEAGGGIQVRGRVLWQGDMVELNARAGAERPGGLTPFELDIGGRALQASFRGGIGLEPKPHIDGDIALRAPPSAGLVRLFGQPAGGAAETLELSAKVAGSDAGVRVSRLKAEMGGSRLSGALDIETGGRRPHARGELHLSQLDLARVLVRDRAQRAEGSAAHPAKPADEAGSRRKARGWSDDQLDLGPLRLADADIALAADRLIYRDVATGPARIALTVADRVATLRLEDVQLYGGRGHGLVTLDGRGEVAVAGASLTADGVSLRPLLEGALDFDWLEGTGSVSLEVAGQGLSERQIVETLNGTAKVSATDGAVTGVDVARLLGRIERGRLTGLRTRREDRTPFSELAGGFQISGGEATTRDLRLVSQHVHVAGTGTAGLARRDVDFTVRTKIAASAAGDAAVIDLSGVEIPVRIAGSWDDPSFTPDLSGIKADWSKAGETIKRVGKNLKSEEVQDALRSFLGGGDGEKKVKPGELLEKLLKRD